MNKGKFSNNDKHQKPQWPGSAGHGPQKPNEHTPGHHPQPNKPWPDHKDKR